MERGCELFSVARSALDYLALRPARDAKLLAWMLRGARQYPDWGYRLAHGHAVNCGWGVNRKRFHRLWKQAKLQQPQRQPQHKVVSGTRLKPEARFRNQVWCYDFVHDRDAAGRPIRCLTLKDEATAYALAIVPAERFDADGVCRMLVSAFAQYDYPA